MQKMTKIGDAILAIRQVGLPAVTVIAADQSDAGTKPNVIMNMDVIWDAERTDGVYKTGLPPGSATALQPIGVGQLAPFFAGISKPYSTPQGMNASP